MTTSLDCNLKPKQRNAVECLLKKDDMLAFLLTVCAFSRIALVGNSTFSWKFSSTGTNSGSADFILATWPLEFGGNFLCFFAPGLLLREDREDSSAVFDLA